MKKVVIASDSFKGSLSSIEVAQSIEKGLKSIYPECEVVSFPIADGGEGTLDALLFSSKATKIAVKAHNPLMEEIETYYAVSEDNKTAFMELALVSGLPLVPVDKRNPLLTTTFGLGELIKDALDKGLREFVIGLGGSATNDAGLGMLQALGFKFLDKNNKLLGKGGQVMEYVASIDTSEIHPALSESVFTIASDVINPFCGINGAAYVFAPQKGADTEMAESLDKAMWSLGRVISDFTGEDITTLSGAGAAGGVGGIFVAFLGASLKPGIQLMLDKLDFERKISDADLIITGEGKADKQTLMGKVPFGVLQKALVRQIPVALIAGSVEDREELINAGFREVCAVTPPGMPIEEAMTPPCAKENIQNTVINLSRNFFRSNS